MSFKSPEEEEKEVFSNDNHSSDYFQVVPTTEDTASLLEQETEENTSELSVEEQPISSNPFFTFILKALRVLVMSVFRIFFVPTVQKAFVKTTIFAITIVWIFVSSLAAYILFYHRYVPPITHVQPIWFQYSNKPTIGPSALIDITLSKPTTLRHEQLYEVSVQLHMPTSDINFDIGNFMVTAELQTRNGLIISKSSRPGILRYQSRPQRLMRVATKAIPLLMGLSEESQVITIKLIDEFMEHKTQAVHSVYVSLSDPVIQVYNAKLLILAKFRGLRYYMYYHRVITAVAFMFTFAGLELVFATIAWKGFGEALWHQLSDLFQENENTSLEDADSDKSSSE
ncbi:putative adipose-regulatory protein-domain-containing protein, partial [Gilbertella persicaria]|uniref:putative adipose-regulatory protein-domain-containing protein n=1 Tax=Gilbertella persicaria TaxID=101096 RepID=UPI00221EF13B